MRGRLPALAAALALVVAPDAHGHPADIASGRPAFRVGVVANSLGWGTRMGREQDLAHAAGARWLREELDWGVVAPRPGARRWTAFDRLFVSASHRGLRLLPLLNGTPSWARTRNRQLPVVAAAYGAFVRDTVRRYGPSGTFWAMHPELDATLAPHWFELWNEPYLVGRADGPVAAARYAQLASAGIAAGRAADPAAHFLVALDVDSAGRPGVGRRWLDRLQRADPGLLNRADGVAVHPYGVGIDNDVSPITALVEDLRVRDLSPPLWITEIGWSTCGTDRRCVTDRRQGRNVSRVLGELRDAFPATIAAVFLYRLRDLRARTVAARYEADFGLVRFDGRRKPAWAAYQRFARGG